MNASDRFELTVAEWLHEDAAHHLPDHLEEVLDRTTTTRQRPAWSSLERWFPMDAVMQPRNLVSPRLGRVVLVVALVVALLALLILGVGRRPRLPEPFGPARNGMIAASADGDIVKIDMATGVSSALIADPSSDFGPSFSRDGTKLLFLRSADPLISSAGLLLVVANADGSGAHAVSPAVDGLDWVYWSPDGTQIAFLSRTLGRGQINLVNADGTGLRRLEVGRPANQLSWLPPTGTEIVFRGEHLLDSDPPSAIFAVHPDGSGLRRISTRPARDRNDYQDVSVSPDGVRIAYRGVAPDEPFRVHVLDIATGVDRVIPAPGGTSQGGPGFSPDGRSLAYLRWYADESTQLVVAPADGSGYGIALGPHGPLGPDGPTITNYSFSPDGTAVLANYDAEKLARLLPVDGSPGSVIARGDVTLPTYQRLAP
jgi:Tol biopolymer transport system component